MSVMGHAECDGKFWKGSKGMEWLLCWLWRMDSVGTRGGGDLAPESNLLFQTSNFQSKSKVHLLIHNKHKYM